MSADTPRCTVCGRDNDYGTHAALEATGHLSHSYTPRRPFVIDAAHIAHQRDWSTLTFGPGDRTAGVIDHIRKELDEIAAQPDDIEEWADLIILAFDGAWRADHDPQAILDAVAAKQAKNEARTWPDWRTAEPGKAIEHVRDEQPCPTCSGPSRETVGLVCQTCGTDYGPKRPADPYFLLRDHVASVAAGLRAEATGDERDGVWEEGYSDALADILQALGVPA